MFCINPFPQVVPTFADRKHGSLNMKKIAIFLFSILCSLFALSQITDSARRAESGFDSLQKTNSKKTQISGAVAVTNNGISLIPTFSLDKPAAIFDMSVSKNRFSFDPEFTFSLHDWKPWYFLFWFRYKIAKTGKFRFTAGTHLGLNFKRNVLPVDGDSSKVLLTQRYVVAELVPNYFISKNISVGAYYLLSHGLDRGTTNLTHFITLNANFYNLRFSNKFYMKAVPQFYYLKIDHDDGFYFTSAVTLAKYNFPLSISAIINEAVKSNINSDDFVWNVSLTYSF